MRFLSMAILSFALAICMTSPASSQCPPPPATSPLAPGEIGLFYDTMGTQRCGSMLSTTTVYLVTRVPEGGFKEYVLPRIRRVSGPTFQSNTFLPIFPAGTPFHAGAAFDACASAYRNDASACPVVPGDLLVMAQYNLTPLGNVQGTACFETVCPTFSGIVAQPPTYVRCDRNSASPFTGGALMCIGINQLPVAVEPFSWGAVKAMYR
jgi:hypothetical protein